MPSRVRVRANDPRAQRKRRPIRVFSFEMHRFAKGVGRYEAMVHVFTDTGMRLGEGAAPQARGLRRRGPHERDPGGNENRHDEHDRSSRAGSLRPSPWLEAQIRLNGPDCDLLFMTPDRAHVARAQLLPLRLETGPARLWPGHPPQECRATPTSPTSKPLGSNDDQPAGSTRFDARAMAVPDHVSSRQLGYGAAGC